MPDWDIELSLTLGKGRVITRQIIIEDVAQQAVAQVAGIEQCLEWANEPDSPIPMPALDYWKDAKRTGAMPYEVLTELESRWNLTFTCKEHVDIPAVATPPAPRPKGRVAPPQPDGRGANPIGLLDQLKQRYSEVIRLRQELDEEYAILSRLFGKPKRKYERKKRNIATAHPKRHAGRRRQAANRVVAQVVRREVAGIGGNLAEGRE